MPAQPDPDSTITRYLPFFTLIDSLFISPSQTLWMNEWIHSRTFILIESRSEFKCSISCRELLYGIMNELHSISKSTKSSAAGVDCPALTPWPPCWPPCSFPCNLQSLNHVNGIKQLNRRQDLSAGVDNQRQRQQQTEIERDSNRETETVSRQRLAETTQLAG